MVSGIKISREFSGSLPSRRSKSSHSALPVSIDKYSRCPKREKLSWERAALSDSTLFIFVIFSSSLSLKSGTYYSGGAGTSGSLLTGGLDKYACTTWP